VLAFLRGASAQLARPRSVLRFFEAQAQRRNLHTKIEGNDAHVGGGEAVARVANICAQAVGEAGSEFVGALALLTQEI